MESNIKIRKQNKILEIEINNYKKQIYSQRNHSNIKNYMPMMNKNYGKYKSLFQTSITENTNLLEKVLKLLEINMDLYNQIKNDSSENKYLFKKVEALNRKNAEIQILNEENENKFKNLKNNGNDLLKKCEKMNLILQNLKNKGNNFMILHESNIRKLKETEELIKKLKNTKNLFEEELNKKTEKMNLNTKLIYQNKRRLIFYNSKLNNLTDDINNLNVEKTRLIQKNSQIEKKLKYYLNNENKTNKKNNDIILNKLKNEYYQIKNINKSKKEELKLKEQEIDNLKRNIDINNSYFDDLTQNSKHIKFNQYFITDNIEEIDIEKNIQLFMNENDKLTKNLNSIFNIYDKQINQKDIIIKNLENQLKNGQYNNYGGANQLKLNDKINISQNNNDNYKKTKTNNLGKNDKINLDEVKKNNYMNII